MKEIDFVFKNGDNLECIVTGFRGVVMVRADYATGCHHYGLIPRTLDKDGKRQDWVWLDGSMLRVVTDSVPVTFDLLSAGAGGPAPSGPCQ